MPLVRQLTRCTWRSTSHLHEMSSTHGVQASAYALFNTASPVTQTTVVRQAHSFEWVNGAQPPQTFVYGSSAHPLPLLPCSASPTCHRYTGRGFLDFGPGRPNGPISAVPSRKRRRCLRTKTQKSGERASSPAGRHTPASPPREGSHLDVVLGLSCARTLHTTENSTSWKHDA